MVRSMWRDGDGVEASRDKGGAVKTRWRDGETKVGVMMEWGNVWCV